MADDGGGYEYGNAWEEANDEHGCRLRHRWRPNELAVMVNSENGEGPATTHTVDDGGG